jgi:hypothetical protein
MTSATFVVLGRGANMVWTGAPTISDPVLLGPQYYGTLPANSSGCASHSPTWADVAGPDECRYAAVALSYYGNNPTVVSTLDVDSASWPEFLPKNAEGQILFNRGCYYDDITNTAMYVPYNSTPSATSGFCQYSCICRRQSLAAAETSTLFSGGVAVDGKGGAFSASGSAMVDMTGRKVFTNTPARQYIFNLHQTMSVGRIFVKPYPALPPYIVSTGKGLVLYPGTTVRDSEADEGGALFADSSTVVVEGSLFERNVATRTGGGAISVRNLAVVDVFATSFIENLARGEDSHGGALQCRGCIYASVFGSRFHHNQAQNGTGGAMFIHNVYTKVVVSSANHFIGNRARMDGGAVYFAVTSDVLVPDWIPFYQHWITRPMWLSDGDTFTGNLCSRGSGGALAIIGAQTRFFTVQQGPTICANNSAPQGGGGCLFLGTSHGPARTFGEKASYRKRRGKRRGNFVGYLCPVAGSRLVRSEFGRCTPAAL